jgi:hypothetical protein
MLINQVNRDQEIINDFSLWSSNACPLSYSKIFEVRFFKMLNVKND